MRARSSAAALRAASASSLGPSCSQERGFVGGHLAGKHPERDQRALAAIAPGRGKRERRIARIAAEEQPAAGDLGQARDVERLRRRGAASRRR